MADQVSGEVDSIGLVEAVRAVRAELHQAVWEGAGSPLRFGLGPIELELTVELRKNVETDGRISVWVISGGAKGTNSDAWVQKVKVQLNPVDKEGNPIQIAAAANPGEDW